MAKSLEQLRAEAEAAAKAYQEAAEKGEDKLAAIARQQDAAIRPVYREQEMRDEHGNLVKIDQNGNPKWRSGQKIAGAHARPVYEPPLRSPYSEPDAPPPDIDFKGTGTWEETEDLWRDLVAVITSLETEKHSQEDRESIVQQIVPNLLDRMAATAPRVDCAFSDGPMSKGAWHALVAKYQTAFNPSKSLERSIGTMASRTPPKFMTFATEGAKWLFRRSPHGIPGIPITQRVSPTGDGTPPEQAPRKRGRPKKVTEPNVPNLE